MAIALAVFDHTFLAPYDSAFGQLILGVIGAIYAAGIIWLRRLARFEAPKRLMGGGEPLTERASPAAPGLTPSPMRPDPVNHSPVNHSPVSHRAGSAL
jgi:hypothetical protein